ncbi:SusC/RagA family TonB-linked outer membrane protein [uncultured Muribaculum sp.]|uniref:SusC/RagA family TonB-linked outer membrane protein n=1 Tax=uncultured Muribaculum sp. TaxID=1918613 RepID=UPI0025B789EF|nr:SusC/RagA family TonB-linked outer membrane protein [uncultured Muribaculum sp.]
MYKKYISVLASMALVSAGAMAQNDSIKSSLSPSQPADIGSDKVFSLGETTGAVSVITGNQLNRRNAKDIGNDILGQGSGLISLQGAGRYVDQNPTFYVRGLQTLNDNNTPLFIVDGIERDITSVSPEDVERVEILKDAAATAIYGYKGINGVVVVTTKRGKANTREITISYDHEFRFFAHTPKFVNGYTYGLAINEARQNDGLGVRYLPQELTALKDQTYPELYPNVNWLDETMGSTSHTNKYAIQFRGGTDKFRYYTSINLLTNSGFIAKPNENSGYSTQDKFSRGNVRMNLDIDLTPTTLVKLNIFGSLTENQQPGDKANLWDMIYTVPSAAFPIKGPDGKWAGSDTWAGTLNPVAQSQGAAYYKNHRRALSADLTIRQDLGMILEGLSANVRVAYDNMANIFENHSKTYVYSVTTPSWPNGAAEPTYTTSIYGVDGEMGSKADPDTYHRYFHFDGGFNYEKKFGDLDLYSQLKWDYEYTDPNGINNTVYRQNVTWWTHLNYKSRYLLDLTLVESGSSRLAPGTKWNFSPTLGLGWVISNENFWSNPDRYLKLRATAGMLNADFLPKDKDGNEVWTYYAQQYVIGGGLYPFDNTWNPWQQTTLGQMATPDPGHEKAYKFNVGVDASPVDGLNVSVDLFKERRKGIWVSSAGKYSSLIGMTAPYENGGIVDSKGIEISADYNKTFGDVTLSVGGNFSYNKNKIVKMMEEPRDYANLVQTGNSVDQLYGLKAIGFFKDDADILNSIPQTFSTVRPGDIKYEDVNDDGVIDANDKVAIGYSTKAPEIFYNFRLGAEWKGLGMYAFFQGTGNYSAILNTKSMYWPLINNTTISQYAYDNRWTPDHQDALFPRLSSSNNANNYQTSTLWLRNRSFLKLRNIEVYYNLPGKFLKDNLKVVSGAKLYVRAIDLFATSNVPKNDPECYGIDPVNKSVAFGLSVTF